MATAARRRQGGRAAGPRKRRPRPRPSPAACARPGPPRRGGTRGGGRRTPECARGPGPPQRGRRRGATPERRERAGRRRRARRRLSAPVWLRGGNGAARPDQKMAHSRLQLLRGKGAIPPRASGRRLPASARRGNARREASVEAALKQPGCGASWGLYPSVTSPQNRPPPSPRQQ